MVVAALLLTILALFAGIAYVGVSGGGTAGNPEATSRGPSGGGTAPLPAASPVARRSETKDAATVRDRAARDEIRKRILEAWAKSGDQTTAPAAREGKMPPMPESPDGGIDPSYIQDVVRADLLPMIKGCYEEMLTRKDAGGRVVSSFKIVGDEGIGGIVEEASVEAEGGLDDEKLLTCIRESTMSLAFRPPPKGGWVTVKYPMTMHP